MDIQKLFEAACTGNVELLHKLLQEKPLILVDVSLTSPPESLLHVATKAGQLNFVRELIKHSPELARELSKDGFMPMDIASMAGNVEIVGELLEVDNNICRLKGKDQRTALHYAAIKGRVEVIYLLLSTCPNSVEDVTVCGETALHLAVENHQIEAFSALLKWLENLGKQPVINWGDCNGNTVLHLAASRKQLQILELLINNRDDIRGIMEVNATNSKGLTAMDLLDIVMETPNDVQLREILRHAGALGAQDVSPIPSTPSLQKVSKAKQAPHQKITKKPNILQLKSDKPAGETRNALLVVAALIATVTFQAGVIPPAGSKESTFKSIVFLFANSLGLSVSLMIIILLTVKFPFRRELLVSVYSMMFAYGVSIDTKKIAETSAVIGYLLLGIAYFLPYFIRRLLPRGPPRGGGKVRK